MPKLHKTHAQQLKIDTKHSNLSLTDVAAALPPTSRKHARSVTSDAAPEIERGKKRSLRRTAILQDSESPETSYDPSESGLSDDGSVTTPSLDQGNQTESPIAMKSMGSPGGSGHSPVDRWMQFTSPETMAGSQTALAHGLDSNEPPVLARQVGIYQADSIIGARDQRVNARYNDVHTVESSTSTTPVHASPTHKRKPPVPSRAHKPGNLSSVGSTARNSVNHSPRLAPWSPEFVANQDLATDDANGNTHVKRELSRDDGKDSCKSLGFAALAQALRETGNKIGIGHHDGSTRKNSVKKSRRRTSDVQVADEQPQDAGPQLGLNIDEPVVVRKWERGDQSSGWTTFA